jgi:hypothetical protein
MAKEPPVIFFDPVPDAMERKIRIGCGSVFGLFIALLVALRWFYFSVGIFAVLAIVFACLFGWLALRYGDRFWREILQALPWL